MGIVSVIMMLLNHVEYFIECLDDKKKLLDKVGNILKVKYSTVKNWKLLHLLGKEQKA